MRFTPRRRAGAALVLAAVAAIAACGKKGPPREPFVRLPGPVADFSVKRVGSTVYLRFGIPSKNQDNSMPADVTRVDVYGFTGKPENDEEIVKYGTLVASVPVRKPVEAEEEPEPPKPGAPREAPKPKKVVEPEPGFDQGAIVTITETLAQPAFEPVVVTRRTKRQKKTALPVEAPILLPLASFDELPSRIYVAVGVNHKNRRGSFSPHAAVPLVDLPAAASNLALTYNEAAITLTWTAAAGAPFPPVAAVPTAPGVPALPSVPGFGAMPAMPAMPAVQEPPIASIPRRPTLTLATPTWSYDVFDATPVKPPADGSQAASPPAPPRVEIPSPLNPQPLTTTTFTDTKMAFGVERCYAVRTLNSFGGMIDEGDASQVACVTPKDTFPPAAPKGLIAVATAGSISLNWQPNTEPDLAGYLVLRGEASGTALTPITREPVKETTYEDKTVASGVRYVYVVVAVDKATPPNISAQSNRIEETAR